MWSEGAIAAAASGVKRKLLRGPRVDAWAADTGDSIVPLICKIGAAQLWLVDWKFGLCVFNFFLAFGFLESSSPSRSAPRRRCQSKLERGGCWAPAGQGQRPRSPKPEQEPNTKYFSSVTRWGTRLFEYPCKY